MTPRATYPVLGFDPSLTHSAGHFAGVGTKVVSLVRAGIPSSRPPVYETRYTSRKLCRFSIKTDPSNFPHRMARLDAMRAHYVTELHRVTQVHGPGLLTVEGYSYGSANGREILAEWGGQVRMTAYHLGWDVVEIPPTTLKKWVTGKGNAKKPEMMLAVEKRWQYKSSDDNDADAFALSQLGSAFMAWRLGAEVAPTDRATFANLEVWEAKHGA